jgi:hypothetical protein
MATKLTAAQIAAAKAKTARDKAAAAKKAAADAAKLAAKNAVVDTDAATLRAKLASQDELIFNESQILAAEQAKPAPSQSLIATYKATLAAQQATRDQLLKQLTSASLSDVEVKSQQNSAAALAVSSAASTVTSTASGTYGSSSGTANGALVYNASAVAEAYFSNKPAFIARVQGPTNRPSSVTQASQLWTSVSGSKGMIVTSEQVLNAWNSGSNKAQTAGTTHENYGFQFQYNPGTVAMSYFTSPNVDVTLMTSGQEMFNLAGVSGSQGSISFQIVINRVFDMHWYNSSGALRQGVVAKDIYPVPPQTTQDFQDLYEKGTMYDVEYLLRVLMGTTMNSYLRGEKTADMGWLPAIPVELHLGKSLRYLGTVNSVNLNHIIFDSRMVPLFTTVDIAFARLPDYPASGTTAGN